MHYDFSYEALLYPDRRPVFVDTAGMPPFESHNTGYSAANAWWLANACQLAYCQECDVGATLAGAGLELIRCFAGPCTQGFLARGDDFAMLVFRGTEIRQMPDILADANFPLASFGDNVYVHCGFLDALKEVWSDAEKALDQLAGEGLRLWYTGYSLGAALASLAAARRPPAALYTFGSPRVGDEAFTRLLCDVPIQRFVNCTDVVPTVPPAPLGYWHVGRLRFLASTGRLMHDPESWHVARRQLIGQYRYALMLPWFRRGMVKSRPLADHAIVNYIAGILNELERTALHKTPQALAWAKGVLGGYAILMP